MGRGQSNIAHSRSANRGRRREGRGWCRGLKGGLLVDKGEDGIMTDIVTAERTMGRGRGSGGGSSSRRWLWWKRKSTTCGMKDQFFAFFFLLRSGSITDAKSERRSIGLVNPSDQIKMSLFAGGDTGGGFVRVSARLCVPPHQPPPP